MTEFVNLSQFELTPEDIKTLVGILDSKKERELIMKLIKLENKIKRCNKNGSKKN